MKDYDIVSKLEDEKNNFESLLDFYKTYLTEDGGASFISSSHRNSIGDHLQYSYLSKFSEVKSIFSAELLERIISRKSPEGYFTDYLNYSITTQLPTNKLILFRGIS